MALGDLSADLTCARGPEAWDDCHFDHKYAPLETGGLLGGTQPCSVQQKDRRNRPLHSSVPGDTKPLQESGATWTSGPKISLGGNQETPGLSMSDIFKAY